MGDNYDVNILLIGGQSENWASFESLLASAGRSFFKANTGDEAKTMLLGRSFAMVFVEMDVFGYEIAEMMRNQEITAHIPIIFVTAGTQEDLKTFQGFEMGPVDCLHKPVHPGLLDSKTRVFETLHKQKDALTSSKKLLDDAEFVLASVTRTDGLTGIANRRHFDEILEKEWGRALRKSTRLSIIMIDIDYFHSYNDSYGHWQGDACLKAIAGVLGQMVNRSVDLVARYGGEEFVALLPENDQRGVAHLAEKIRAAVESLHIDHMRSRVASNLTISLGTATLVPGPDQGPSDLVTQAERALYVAKLGGRNRVSAALLASD